MENNIGFSEGKSEHEALLTALSEEKSSKQVGYIELLRKNSNFRNLWFGQLISAAGDWFNNVALLGLALALTGSGLASGMVLLATSLPYFFLIPIAGPLVDRFDRKKVMIAANLGGAVAALSFLLVRDSSLLWLLYVGSALLISTAAFFNPASSAIVPTVVNERELYSANALTGSTWGIMVMVGSGLGGIVSATFGRDIVFVINSLSFLLSTILIWQIKLPPSAKKIERETHVEYSTWKDFVAGLAYLRSHRPVMALASSKAGWGLAGGVLVLLSVFGDQIFKAGDSGIGLLFAGRGLGALVGPILIRPLVGTSAGWMRTAIGLAFMVQALGYLIFGLSAPVGIVVAAFALVLGHCGGGITWVGSSVLLQQSVPDQYRGRVFAIDLGLSTLTNSLSTLAWSLALNEGASPVVLALAGAAVFMLYGFFWFYLTARPSFRISC
ncbi:MAG TPA: MFS transporter [Chloroflexia bacterium]|nr:MFS transporter [Chloroflexia bacterium]